MINTNLLRLAALLVPVAVLTTSCRSRDDTTERTTVAQTSDGAVIVDTYTQQATVTAIDPASRELTLVAPDGHKTKYKAGPEVTNFSQIRVGDQVKAVLSEQVAVAIGSNANFGVSSGEVALAPVGAKPGGVAVATEQITATITKVDARRRKVTYLLPDGTTKTVKADKNVDVSNLKPGENVTVQVSEGLVLSVQRP